MCNWGIKKILIKKMIMIYYHKAMFRSSKHHLMMALRLMKNWAQGA